MYQKLRTHPFHRRTLLPVFCLIYLACGRLEPVDFVVGFGLGGRVLSICLICAGVLPRTS